MSEYEQIIVEVKSGLTESKEQNYKYLLEQSEKYKQHPMAHEILKEIGRLLYDNLPTDGKENFSNAMDNDIRKLNKKIDEANDNIVKGNFNKAKELLNEYLEAFLNMYKEDQITRYFTFSDIVEFYCSKNKLKIDKKVVWVDMRADDAYKLLAYISSEEKKFDKSFEYLEKGLYFNPMSLGIRFEKAETYKMQRNLDKMYDAIKEIYPYIYDQSNLSRYYRLLGYYYIEKEKYDLAYSLFAISIYYENDQMAHNEINYIKQRLGNPKYELSTKEIIGILKRENIPMTILEENLIQLKNFSNEIEVIKKQPKLVDKIKERIILFSNEINEDEEIKGLRITVPKITTEDIYDEKKLILDDNDKNRIAKNIEILKQNNIPFIENLKNIPFNSCTSLKSKEEILGRLLVDYAVATCALYSLEGKANIIESVINQMDQKLKIKKVLSEEDNMFLKGMYEEKVSKQKLQDITWLFEECAVLTWVLGLLDKPQSKNECNVSVLDELFFNTESYEQLLSKCNLKSKEEVLEFADLIFRYNWACIESRMQGQQLSQLNGMIVQEQKRALEWVLDWKIEKLMKEKINIKFKKDNFDFSFETPSSLHINNITNPNDLTLLFSLANEKGERALTLHNLGPCNSATRLDNFYEHDVEKYKKDNWNIVGEYNVSSYNLGSNIKQLVAYKTTPEVKDYIFGLCLYYFVLNGHIVLLEVVVDENLDYSVIDNVMNFKNNMLAANVLFSIKENKSDSQLNKTVDMARILNYRLHAEQLSIPVLNNFVIENPEEPQIVFSASNQAFVQQLVSDGPLESNETFEQRLNFVVKDTINFMKAHNKENTDKCLFYYKDYSNGIFNYKIYVQDFIINANNENKIVRQLNAYFVEPKFNDFYQMTVLTAPLSMPTETLKIGVVDLENDLITQSLDNMLNIMMKNLQYRDGQDLDKTEVLNMNGIDVPVSKIPNGDNNVVMADPGKLFLAAIESSVIMNLDIIESDPFVVENIKNLYRVILTCGEFEDPFIDENNLADFLKDSNKVINLVRKFKDINEVHFKNELPYLTFDTDNEETLNYLIGILKISFKPNEEKNSIEEKSENMNYEYINEEEPSVTNNEYDYSNIIPTIDSITYLVQYCDSVYKQFIGLVEEDEKRNEQFKTEYKNYNYKKSYAERLEVYIRQKNYNNITCKDFASFSSAVSDGNLKNVSSLEIKMELNYKRGKGNNLVEHENVFTITFKPYEITFIRKSSHNESNMNQIENTIKDILSKFPVANSIFCTK